MSAAMSHADHLFIEALTALALRIVADRMDDQLLVDVAVGISAQVNLEIPALCRVARCFSAWQAARRTRPRPPSETLELTNALFDFHRWRTGQAQAALQARAA